MITRIRAIETRYNGYRFRSRLEARWAVFFDAMGIKYEYEKDGFHLPDGSKYLPDFWLPTYNAWAEIKPEPVGSLAELQASPAFQKCDALTQLTGQPCMLLMGVPGEHTIGVSGTHAQVQHLLYCWRDSPRQPGAILAARQARFEHGERPRF